MKAWNGDRFKRQRRGSPGNCGEKVGNPLFQARTHEKKSAMHTAKSALLKENSAMHFSKLAIAKKKSAMHSAKLAIGNKNSATHSAKLEFKRTSQKSALRALNRHPINRQSEKITRQCTLPSGTSRVRS